MVSCDHIHSPKARSAQVRYFRLAILRSAKSLRDRVQQVRAVAAEQGLSLSSPLLPLFLKLYRLSIRTLKHEVDLDYAQRNRLEPGRNPR